MNDRYWSHYEWLDVHFDEFLDQLKINHKFYSGLISAHGDKCYGYRRMWKKEGIPFCHGSAIYLLSYMPPWSHTVRDTKDGFIPPAQWVIDNYPKYKHALSEEHFDRLEEQYK